MKYPDKNEKHSSAKPLACGAVYFILNQYYFMGYSNKMNMCEDHVYDLFCECKQRNAHKDILISDIYHTTTTLRHSFV